MSLLLLFNAASYKSNVKVSGAFAPKPVYVKIAGTFVQKPAQVL
jgi:hypothetical protein